MKLNKTFGRIATTLVATAMLASVAAVPAMAEPIQAVSGVTFTQTLDMSGAQGAGLPDVTISYEIANTGFEIPEDSIAEVGVGTPTIADVTFDGDPAAVDNVYTETATVNFNSVTFEKPGVYRYMITRNDSDSTSLSATDNDVRYLDVYVGWDRYDDETGTTVPNDAQLVIYDYVLVTSNVAPDEDGIYREDDEILSEAEKSAGYANAYTTTSLELNKNVTGGMGNKSEKFSFTINLTDCETATVHVAYGTTAKDYDSDEPIVLTDAIASGEKITVTGLPVGTSYSIEETDSLDEGYTISYAGATQDKDNLAKATGTIATGVNSVTVTNDRDAVSPTGLIMDIAPYVLLVVVAAAGCFVFLRKRRED